MGNFRPHCDVWILARPRLRNGEKYYGSFPLGFPERARRLLGVSMDDAVLHVCSGRVRQYPYAGAVGPNDKTIDLDANTFPDYCIDVRKLKQWPDYLPGLGNDGVNGPMGWPAMLIDPPYTEEDAKHYLPGCDQFPKLNVIMRNASERLRVGGRIGVLAYLWPAPPKKLSDGSTMREVAVIAVGTGRNQRARWFTVFEKFAAKKQKAQVQHVPDDATGEGAPVGDAAGVDAGADTGSAEARTAPLEY